MMKLALGVALALTAVTATSAAADTFVLDGQTYTYETASRADGSYELTGTVSNGAKFHYIVHNGKVTGTVNGRPIDFTAADARGSARWARPVKAAVATK